MGTNSFYCLLIAFFCNLQGFSQPAKSDQKVFFITLDGLRWQELFSGADSLLVSNEQYVKHLDKVYLESAPLTTDSVVY